MTTADSTTQPAAVTYWANQARAAIRAQQCDHGTTRALCGECETESDAQTAQIAEEAEK